MMHLRRRWLFCWLPLCVLILQFCGCGGGGTPRVVEEHWPDGSLKVRRTVVSDWQGYEANHGTLEVWYENGQQRSLGHWQYGQKHGEFVYWHTNGQKKMELTNRNGRAHGRVREWDAGGQLIRDEEWRDGRPVAES